MVLVILVIKYEVVLEIIIIIVFVQLGYCIVIGKNFFVVFFVYEIFKFFILKEKIDLCNDCKKYFWIEFILNFLSGLRFF